MATMNSLHHVNIQKVLISFIFRPCISSRHHQAVSRYSTESEAVTYAEKNEEELAQIEKKRNKSRMADHFRNRMEANLKLQEINFSYQLTTAYKRRMYAQFGRASGIEPSIMWPTKQEVQAIIEHEKEFYPTLEEMVHRRREKRMLDADSIRKREESVEYGMSKLGKWLEELKLRRDKKLNELQAQKDKKELLVEEVRQYFGYRLSPKDPKFIEILEKKEKEEKKSAKIAKKQERMSREIAKLAGMAQAGAEGATAGGYPPKKPSEGNN